MFCPQSTAHLLMWFMMHEPFLPFQLGSMALPNHTTSSTSITVNFKDWSRCKRMFIILEAHQTGYIKLGGSCSCSHISHPLVRLYYYDGPCTRVPVLYVGGPAVPGFAAVGCVVVGEVWFVANAQPELFETGVVRNSISSILVAWNQAWCSALK